MVFMATVTLEKVSHDLDEIKLQLSKITHFLEEDFDLTLEVKKELQKARKEPLSKYINHRDVLKEFL